MTNEPDRYVTTSATDAYVDRDGRTVVQPTTVAPVEQVVERVVVAQPAALAPVMHERVAVSTGRRYAFDAVIVGIVGIVLVLIGLIAVIRAGVDGPMDQPIVEVLGFTHTATLGIIEAALGLMLLLCAATASRGGSVFFGLVLGIGGFIGAVQTSSFRKTLALESGHAWLMVVLGVIVVLVSLLMPRMVTRTDRVEAV